MFGKEAVNLYVRERERERERAVSSVLNLVGCKLCAFFLLILKYWHLQSENVNYFFTTIKPTFA